MDGAFARTHSITSYRALRSRDRLTARLYFDETKLEMTRKKGLRIPTIYTTYLNKSMACSLLFGRHAVRITNLFRSRNAAIGHINIVSVSIRRRAESIDRSDHFFTGEVSKAQIGSSSQLQTRSRSKLGNARRAHHADRRHYMGTTTVDRRAPMQGTHYQWPDYAGL